MNLGFSEMLFIFLFALIIFGPKKLPEIGRQIGKALAEFKRASNEFKSQLETEMRQIEIEELLRKEKESMTEVLQPPPGTVTSGAATASPGESSEAISPESPALESPAQSEIVPVQSEEVKRTDA